MARPVKDPDVFRQVAKDLGELVTTKNRTYGDAYGKTGDFLRLLYPDGISPEQYEDFLAIVRVWDKLMRIATAKRALGESPWQDIGGYALLAIAQQKPVRDNPWPQRQAALRKAANQTWQYLFEEPLPDNIEVRWVPYLGKNAGQATSGAIHSGGVIKLDWSYLNGRAPLSVLVHEFGHARGFGPVDKNGNTRHDRAFRTRVNEWLGKLGLSPEK